MEGHFVHLKTPRLRLTWVFWILPVRRWNSVISAVRNDSAAARRMSIVELGLVLVCGEGGRMGG